MKTKLLKEVAKLQANLAKEGSDKAYVQQQLKVAPVVQEKIEAIMPKVEAITKRRGVYISDYNFEWTDKGNFTIHVGGKTSEAWTNRVFQEGSKPSSKLDALLYELGQVEGVVHVEDAAVEVGEDIYLLIMG